MKHDEISPETRLLLIELAEGFAAGVRNNTFKFSEESGKRICEFIDRLNHPEKYRRPEEECNITEACRYLHMSQPTFRKYIKESKIPGGRKRDGGQPMWLKSDIIAFGKWWFSKQRKR